MNSKGYTTLLLLLALLSPLQSVFALRSQENGKPLDSLVMTRKDTTQKQLLHFSGLLSCESVVSDRRLPFQSTPPAYVRLMFQPVVDIGVIPFRGSFMISSEQFSVNHQFNNYSFSFDYLTFTDRLRKQVANKKRIEDSLSATDSLLRAYKLYRTRYNTLKMQLSNPRYLQDIERHKRILMADTLKVKGKNFQVQQARLKLKQHEDLQNELKEIESRLPLLENYKRNKNVEGLGKDLQQPSLNAELKTYGLHSGINKQLLALKRLDLGNTSPDYSELTIRGTSITGVNIEYNPGNFYTAFAYGKTVTNFINPLAINFHSSRTLMAARIGYGKKEGSLLCATLLKGSDGRGAEVRDSNFTYYEPSSNTVLSIQGRWKWKNYLMLEGEYAGSIMDSRGSKTETAASGNKSTGISRIVSDAFSQNGHQAMYAKASSEIAETGTELMLSWRNVQSRYFTFGNPFLRPDNQRSEGKISQKFLNRQLKLSASFRRDEDNTLLQKQFTTITSLYSYSADLHLRNKPFFVFTYTPSIQYYKGTERNNQYISRTRIYILTTGYTYKLRRTTYATVVVNSLQHLDSKLVNWDYRVTMHSLAQQVIFKSGISLSGNGTCVYSTGKADSVFNLSTNAGLSWMMKKKYRVSSGVLYQYTRHLQQRSGLYAGVSFPWGKTGRVELRVEEHLVNEKRVPFNTYMQTLARLRLTKNF